VGGTARYVFGYGSLAAWAGRGEALAELAGARRVWGVAMDNRVEIPGYKVYVDPADGSRPPVHVAFLDLADAASSWRWTHGRSTTSTAASATTSARTSPTACPARRVASGPTPGAPRAARGWPTACGRARPS
jgi:hypothetical protein